MGVGFLLADRVKETTTTTGTGTISLAGTSTGFRTFVAGIGNGNKCYYCIVHQSADEWEVGQGTVTDAATDTLSRDTILASSNSNAAVNFSSGTKDVFVTHAANANTVPGTCGGRLTLTSGTPVTTTDVTGAPNIYFTPHLHNRVALFDGKTWRLHTFSEVTLALGTLINAQAYDLFLYDNSGTLTLDPVEWSNATVTMTIATPCVVTWTGHGLSTGDSVTLTTSGALPTGLSANTQYFITKIDANTFNLSTSLANVAAGTKIATSGSQSGTHTGHSPRNRQTALATQDGVYVKSGSTNKLYVGSFMTTSTTTTEDSYGGASQAGGKRFLWNAYNRLPRELAVIDTTDSWTYTTATWRQADAATGNLVQCLLGLSIEPVRANAMASARGSGTMGYSSGVGIDSTNTNSAKTNGVYTNTSAQTGVPLNADYRGYPGAGYHNLVWLEISQALNTTVWEGDGGLSYVQSGLQAEVWA